MSIKQQFVFNTQLYWKSMKIKNTGVMCSLLSNHGIKQPA